MTDVARARSMTAGAAGALLLPLVLTACASPLGGGPDEPSPSAVLERAAERRPDVPLVVPVDPPEGWRLDSANGDRENGRTVTQELVFVSEDLSAAPVTVCVQRRSDAQERCRGALDADRQVVDGGVAVVQAPGDDTAALRDWADVELTEQWRELSWVRGDASVG